MYPSDVLYAVEESAQIAQLLPGQGNPLLHSVLSVRLMAPESRRSDNLGRLSSRLSTDRDSWHKQITGTFREMASSFSSRLMAVTVS